MKLVATKRARGSLAGALAFGALFGALLALFGVAPSRAAAQVESTERPPDQRYATWFGAFLHGPIAADGQIWLWADLHGRFDEPFRPQAALVRPGISWHPFSDLWLTLGYGWTPSWSPVEGGGDDDLNFFDEHRIWEQLIYKPKDEATGFVGQLRVRFEQRMRSEGPFEVGLRLRVFWRTNVPFSQELPELTLALWDEAFIALTDSVWGQRAGIDQNRAFLGLGYQVIPGALRMEVGYTNVWVVRGSGDTLRHVVALNGFISW